MTHEMRNERLRDAYLGGEVRPARLDECPDDDAIWSAVRGELSSRAIEALIAHSLDCAACAESFRIARELSLEMQAVDAAPPRRRHSHPVLYMLAVAAAVIVGLVWLTPSLRDNDRVTRVDEFRDPVTDSIDSKLEDGSVMDGDSFLLRWSTLAPGTLYTVEVATEDLTVIHRAREIEQTEYRVPSEAFSGIASGTAIFWRVEGVLPDATRVSSPLFRAILQ